MFRSILPLLIWLAAAPGATAQNWGMGGLDPVEQRGGRAVPGQAQIATEWRGTVWVFATEANREIFEADPRRFAPMFGGLCPVALAEGRRVPGDPRLAVEIGDRLYLLRSPGDVARLRADPQGILARARAAMGGQ